MKKQLVKQCLAVIALPVRSAALLLAALAIATSAQAQTTYTNGLTGYWSAAGSWSATPGIPPVGGGAGTNILFNPAATDNSTNDLAGAFWLNQMSLVASYNVTNYAASGNSLLFTNTSGGTLPLLTNAVGNALVLNSAITLATNLTVGVASGGSIVINSNITDRGLAFAITNTGAGTLTLAGSNSFTGGLYINNGTVANTATYALGGNNNNAPVYLNAGPNANATLKPGTSMVVTNPITVQGTGTNFIYNANANGPTFYGAITLSTDLYLTNSGSGTITVASLITGTNQIICAASGSGPISLLNTSPNFSGNVVVSQGSLTLGQVLTGQNNIFGTVSNLVIINAGTTLNVNHSATGTIAGLQDGTGSGTVQVSGSTSPGSTLILGGSGNYSFSGSIYNSSAGLSLALTKTNSGTQTLSGTCTNTGATAVSGGTLLINGNASAATNVWTVKAGATLGGKGTIGGAVKYQSGSLAAFTITPEASDSFSNSTYMTFTNSVFMTNVTVGVSMPANLPVGTYVLATNYVTPATSGSFTFVTNSGSLAAGNAGTVKVSGNNLILTVAPPALATTNTVTLFSGTLNYGSQLIFATTVDTNTAPFGAASGANGNFVFSVDGTAVYTSTVNGSGTAYYTNSTLLPGSHTITAQYMGDSTYAPCMNSLVVFLDNVKADNAVSYDQGGSWVSGIAPGVSDLATWNGAYTPANLTNALLASVTWGGICISNVTAASGPVAFTNSSAGNYSLNLNGVGGVGIDMSSATVDLNLSGYRINAQSNQLWSVANGHTITINTIFDINSSATLTITNGGNVVVAQDLYANGNYGTLVLDGPGAVYLNGISCMVPATNTVLNGGTLYLNNGGSDTPGARSRLTINGGTIDNTNSTPIGSIFAFTNYWNGNFTYGGTAPLTFNAIDPVVLGSSLAIACNSNILTVPGVISDNGNHYSLAKAGVGTLAIIGANTYSGNTVVSNGTLVISTLHAGGGGFTVNDGASLTVTNAGGASTAAIASLTAGSSGATTLGFEQVSNLTTPLVTCSGSLTVNGAGTIAILGTKGLASGNQYPLISVAGSLGGSGSLSLSLPFNLVANLVTNVGSPTVIALNVTYVMSTNAYLAGLVLSPNAGFAPGFTTNGYLYYATNSYGQTPTVTVTNADPTATNTLIVNGVSLGVLTNETASVPLTLGLGNTNVVAVQVVSQDLSRTNTYTVDVTVLPPPPLSTNAYLAGLVLSPNAGFAPGFTTNGYLYYATNSYGQTPTVTVTNADPTATNTLIVNGVSLGVLTNETASVPLTLGLGNTNVVQVRVVSQDLSVTNTYTVDVMQLGSPVSSDASLSYLAVTPGTLSPVFATGTTNYAVTNTYAGSPVTVTVTNTSSAATNVLLLDGIPQATNSGSLTVGSLSLNVGSGNVIQVVVTAQDGVTTSTNTVTVTRLGSTNALLSNLYITPGTLTPSVFAAGTTNYTATNTYPAINVTVTATSGDGTAALALGFNTPGSYGTLLTNGVASVTNTMSLASPANVLAVQVVSQDLSQTNVYTVNELLQPSQSVPHLTNSVSGNNLVMSWAADHLGYRLLVQTNNLNKGVSGNIADWGVVTNSATTTSTNIAIIKTGVTNEYYRLVYP